MLHLCGFSWNKQVEVLYDHANKIRKKYYENQNHQYDLVCIGMSVMLETWNTVGTFVNLV